MAAAAWSLSGCRWVPTLKESFRNILRAWVGESGASAALQRTIMGQSGQGHIRHLLHVASPRAPTAPGLATLANIPGFLFLFLAGGMTGVLEDLKTPPNQAEEAENLFNLFVPTAFSFSQNTAPGFLLLSHHVPAPQNLSRERKAPLSRPPDGCTHTLLSFHTPFCNGLFFQSTNDGPTAFIYRNWKMKHVQPPPLPTGLKFKPREPAGWGAGQADPDVPGGWVKKGRGRVAGDARFLSPWTSLLPLRSAAPAPLDEQGRPGFSKYHGGESEPGTQTRGFLSPPTVCPAETLESQEDDQDTRVGSILQAGGRSPEKCRVTPR
ncbi:uncharacterized protein LOC124968681 [Sciurus carolinensis]|uniref:uncharacterized protein LOC124968681 n=1 Tax=Sciurus carolinensis TaxID=30640 RepID=UPI001FB1DA42|nr:uncharacterized protein LOC124968681 [Sciurus carolinensis]XP_047387327.1 uncharacterized protein LOC124968681 [Sciurus carolinensis]XP_047387328.1 uncharacterized protein LOC124968681 [Sciurus carolinensis]XP_047387329.1 uncharacterized protein LOC124968681 [Sciurus carolinensis]XP_047387330.1 uncharacterized protein LOC124968681 [Sciurus carolinensis]XP_047387331.1 uncharacterized protein LOC124968681 [Sciurus carolinensis]XP_047387332.1 uncharacterized protein LOC124968681 [Sciurus caro